MEVEVAVNQEFEDGYLFYQEELCTNCGGDDLSEIGHCAICGDTISEKDKFCKDCLDDINQVLTDFMEFRHIDAVVLEDLVSEHYGW